LESNRGAPEPAPEPEPAIRLRLLSGMIVKLPWAFWKDENVDQLMQDMDEGRIDGIPRAAFPTTQYAVCLGARLLQGLREAALHPGGRRCGGGVEARLPYTLADAGVVPGAELTAVLRSWTPGDE